jgi:hypothetical protein
MKINERTGWVGEWEIIIRDRAGNIIERTGLRPNLIMDAGLNMFADLLAGTITDGEIKYVALGNGGSASTVNMTKLESEKWRKQTTFQTRDANTPGLLVTELFVADFEANDFKCEEIGWFCGSGASGTKDSGIMIARVLYSRQKTNLESWTIRRTDTIGRGS